MPACRGCGAPVTFTLTKTGKWMPVDPDRKSHFATCPAAPRNRKPPIPKTICHKCGSNEVEQLPAWGPHAASLRCRACRAHRWLSKTSVAE